MKKLMFTVLLTLLVSGIAPGKHRHSKRPPPIDGAARAIYYPL